MDNPSQVLFNSIKTFKDLESLIDNGEAENQFIECKSPVMPKFSQDLQAQVAQAISGFANTNGGIIIVGMGTTNKVHSGLDILTQIEEVGNINIFSKQILVKMPTLTTPSANTVQHKIIKKLKTNTKGVMLIYIPQTQGEPYQSNIDSLFYFRTGAEFKMAPYDMIKRLFASTDKPDISVKLNDSDIKLNANKEYEIDLAITNKSYAAGENVEISIEILEQDSCESLRSNNLRDISQYNPGKKLYSTDISRVVHRGMNLRIGQIIVKMKTRKKKLTIICTSFSSKMIPRDEKFVLILGRKSSVKTFPVKYV